LEFLDGTFNMVTAFYSLMYMTAEDHRRVFNEVYRVLTKEGVFKIWDVQLTHQGDTDKPGFVIPIEVILPDRKISTGYGSHWPKESYGLNYYIKIAEQTGFKIVKKTKLTILYPCLSEKQVVIIKHMSLDRYNGLFSSIFDPQCS